MMPSQNVLGYSILSMQACRGNTLQKVGLTTSFSFFYEDMYISKEDYTKGSST